MDEETHRYYEAFAEELAQRYDNAGSGIERLLPQAFSRGMRVIDVGAGSGRDMCSLLEMGVDVYGVEPSDQLRGYAILRHPALEGRLEAGRLPDLGQPFGGQFDGVLCSAVFMHVPRDKVLDAALALRSVLKEHGRLLVSIPLGRPGLDARNRDLHGRLFTPLDPDYLELLFERLGFQMIGRWESEDVLGREGHNWFTLLFHLSHTATVRPIDEIAGVLSRDRKTATYKLALFRALSEIAITEFEQARWVGSGTVGIPVDVVSEKWLLYYWSLFASERFVPQIRGESEQCQKPVAFRQALDELIRYYEKTGGLARFVLDWRSNQLDPQAWALLQTALRRIRNTIIQGPVTFSGGSLETGRVFQYDADKKVIKVPSAIWRELSLLGHWIQEAVILKWAELTSEISRWQVRPSEVIDLLLITPLPERDVFDAREVYTRLPGRECAWTGEPLRNRFDVDHIIPFSLWHNNDLWNLLPVLPAVNSQKGDRLPTRNLMLSRKNYILSCWEALHLARPPRFEHEVCRVVGAEALPDNWRDHAFRCVVDAVEMTAIQRGHERWQP